MSVTVYTHKSLAAPYPIRVVFHRGGGYVNWGFTKDEAKQLRKELKIALKDSD